MEWLRRGQPGWSHIGLLPCEPVVYGHLPAINQIGIFWIRRDFAVLLDVHRMPVVKSDLAIHATAVDAGRTRILLSAAKPIRERVVGSHVIHGAGGLGIPVAPRFTAIRRNHAALIADQQNDIRIVGIDPALLVVVATGCTTYGGPGQTGVLGPPENGRAAVYNLLVFRIDGDCGEVPATDAPQRTIVRRVTTGRSGFKNAGVLGG